MSILNVSTRFSMSVKSSEVVCTSTIPGFIVDVTSGTGDVGETSSATKKC